MQWGWYGCEDCAEEDGLVRAPVRRFTVPDTRGLDSMVASHLAQGFEVVGRTERSAVLRRGRRFNPGLAALSSLFCGVGLLVYLMVHAARGDEVVEVAVIEPGQGLAQLSDDRRWWWDGERWRDAEQVVPPGRRRSADGALWWDGVAWRPVPASERAWSDPAAPGARPEPGGPLSQPAAPPPPPGG